MTHPLAQILRDAAHYAEIDPFPPSYQYVKPAKFREAADLLERLSARERRLSELVRCLIENDPDAPISDSGHVVIDLWRHDARQVLGLEDAA